MLDKKIDKTIITIVVLIACLSISTFALIYNKVAVKDNTFITGNVKININDNSPIIEENEYLFEPGMTIKKDFFITNNSSTSVYYKIYFDNVVGDLKDVIEVTIKDKDDKVLYKDILANISDDKTIAYDDLLEINQRKDLSIYFYYPSNSNNNTQNKSLSFNLCVKAVQTKNNEERLFD